MKTKIIAVLAAVMASLGWHAHGQTYDTNNEVVQTFAGSGFSGYVDGVGQLTMFNNPNAIVADTHSNLFVWDSGNYRIRKIAPDGTVTTFAGGGSNMPGTGTNANLTTWGIGALTIDSSNTLWAVSGAKQFSELEATGKLAELETPKIVTAENKNLDLQFNLPRQGVSLLLLTPNN